TRVLPSAMQPQGVLSMLLWECLVAVFVLQTFSGSFDSPSSRAAGLILAQDDRWIELSQYYAELTNQAEKAEHLVECFAFFVASALTLISRAPPGLEAEVDIYSTAATAPPIAIPGPVIAVEPAALADEIPVVVTVEVPAIVTTEIPIVVTIVEAPVVAV